MDSSVIQEKGKLPNMTTRFHSFSFAVTRYHLLSLVVIRFHSLSFVVIHCHSFSFVVTRCHSLSLDVAFAYLFINNLFKKDPIYACFFVNDVDVF